MNTNTESNKHILKIFDSNINAKISLSFKRDFENDQSKLRILDDSRIENQWIWRFVLTSTIFDPRSLPRIVGPRPHVRGPWLRLVLPGDRTGFLRYDAAVRCVAVLLCSCVGWYWQFSSTVSVIPPGIIKANTRLSQPATYHCKTNLQFSHSIIAYPLPPTQALATQTSSD